MTEDAELEGGPGVALGDLPRIEPGDLDDPYERAAAEVRREFEAVIDVVADQTNNVLYFQDSAEVCDDEADGTRFGQTVFLEVAPEDQEALVDVLQDRWTGQGHDPVRTPVDGGVPLEFVEDDGTIRSLEVEGRTMALTLIGSCQPTGTSPAPSLAEASAALEIPAAVVIDGLVVADSARDEGTTMPCDGDRTASLLFLYGEPDPDADVAAVEGFPADGRVILHGDHVYDVVTPDGTISVRQRGSFVNVTSRTRCATPG